MRSIWKVSTQAIKCTSNVDFKQNKIKIFNSNFVILKDFIGYLFYVYNGRRFKKIIINDTHVNILLSTLIITRYNNGAIHVNKKNKKSKKKK